ncbi:MAG: hypothetical protein WAO95_00940 [Burkholderiales bacterium]
MARILKGGIALGALLAALFFPAQSFAQSRPCGCYCGKWLPAPCSDAACKQACGWQAPSGSSPAPGSSGPSIDYEAERRSREEAERQREETERQREEAERREQDRLKAERQKQFESERDAAAKSLKGSGSSPGGGLTGPAPVSADAAPAAWKQLHCATSILGPALAAAAPASGKAPDFAESRYLLGEAQKALNGQPLGVQCAAAPALPQTSRQADLEQATRNQQCLTNRAGTAIGQLEQAAQGSPKEAQARRDIERIAMALKKIEGGAIDGVAACGEGTVAGKGTAAAVRREQLTRQVEKNAEAIRRLGFARRAEDFAEWERLAAKAKAEFEGEVIDVISDIAVDKARGKILDSFKGFDAAKANRMAGWIRARGIKPEPTALLAAIDRVGRATDKSRVADDAEFIVKQIEDLRKARAAAPDPVESAKFIGGLLEGTLSDPRLVVLVTELKLTTAAVYNNATRRVARHEVERLTLTEKQLKDLERLQKLMVKHVQELKALNAGLESASK